jgi:hypothetical protein
MKESVIDPVDQSEDTSGAPEKKDSVSFDSFQKLLKEKKSKDSKLSELEKELVTLRDEKNLAEGKKEEVLVSQKKRIEELEKTLRTKDQTYAWSTLTGEIKRESMKYGCKDPDKLIRLMSDDDLKSIEVGEDFSINKDTLKEVIERSKKENYFLFGETQKITTVGKPSNSPVNENTKSIKDMSIDELRAEYKKQTKR